MSEGKDNRKSIARLAYRASLAVAVVFFVLAVAVIADKTLSRNRKMPEADYAKTTVDCNLEAKDIGTIKRDTTVSFSYVFKNTGADSLRVLFINPDCNCTSYKFSSMKVPVNDSIVLTLDIDMRNKHRGKFMLSTVVALNTEQRLYSIRVTGEVE